MRADVAFAQRAVDRVGEGVERSVGVGVALELCRVRDAHAAQPDGVAGLERMDVEAGAGAGFHGLASQQALGALEIFGMGELDVARRALGEGDRDACPLGDGGVVGELGWLGGRAAVGVEDRCDSAKPCGVCAANSVRRSSVPSANVPSASA